MTATKYNVVFADGTSELRSKKASAIALGESRGMAFQVWTVPGGAIVHDAASDVDEPVVEDNLEPCLHCGGTIAHDPACPAFVDRDEHSAEDTIDASYPYPVGAPVEDEPTPDQGQADRTGPSTKFDFEDMKRKVQGLLAKAEGTDNEHERDAFNAKAEKLMLKLGIARAELEADGKLNAEPVIRAHRDFPGNYSIVMLPFVADIASGFGHITTLQTTYKGNLTRRAWIIGHASDVEAFLLLLDSLTRQVMAALKVWQKENIEVRRHQTDMERYLGHRSFITGFGVAVRTRLLVERKAEREQASSGAELVLVSKNERIKDWVSENIGELSKAKGGPKNGSRIGFLGGVAAGEKADLGGETAISGPQS